MWASEGSTTVTVMTQNMDAGTDLKFALAYLNTDTPTVGIDLTYQELLSSNFAGRAGILARKIAAAKPHIVAPQEATLWSTGSNATDQTPKYDQLQLLQSRPLSSRGLLSRSPRPNCRPNGWTASAPSNSSRF